MNNEITLADFWAAIVKNKILFWSVFFVILLAGTFFVIQKKDVFEYRVSVKMPYLFRQSLSRNGVIYLANAAEVEKLVSSIYLPKILHKYRESNLYNKKSNKFVVDNNGRESLTIVVKDTAEKGKVIKSLFGELVNTIKQGNASLINNTKNSLLSTIKERTAELNYLKSIAKTNQEDSHSVGFVYSLGSIRIINSDLAQAKLELNTLSNAAAVGGLTKVGPVGISRVLLSLFFVLLAFVLAVFVVLTKAFLKPMVD